MKKTLSDKIWEQGFTGVPVVKVTNLKACLKELNQYIDWHFTIREEDLLKKIHQLFGGKLNG